MAQGTTVWGWRSLSMTAFSPDFARPHPLSHAVVWLSVAVGTALVLVLAFDGRWLPAGLMIVATTAAALASLLRLPGTLIGVLAAASVINAASIDWDWYTAWPPFDEWAHLLNPALLVAPSMIWLQRAGFVAARPEAWSFVLVATLYGMALAVGWEGIELFFWSYPLSDTLSDIGLGVLGSAAGGWWAGRLIAPDGYDPSPLTRRHPGP